MGRLSNFNYIYKGTEKQKSDTGKIIRYLVEEKIEILPLFRCERAWLEAVEKEAKAITCNFKRGSGDWNIPKMSFKQYNLYSRSDDPDAFLEETDIWRPGRRFLSKLEVIPAMLKHYFGKSVLQNCRLLTVNHFGLLAPHREPIIGIPGKPNAYKIRFHLPLSTSPRVNFFMTNHGYTMRKGNFYLYNQSCSHGVENVLGVKRAHLVFDFYLNRYLLENMILPSLGEVNL